MAIVFPASPSVNDTFTEGSITYKWDGAKWIGLGVTPADRLVEGSNSLEITAGNDLVWTGDNIGLNTSSPEAKLEVRDSNSQGVIIRSDNTQSTNTNKALRIRNNSADNTFWVSHKGFTQITINDDTDYSTNTTNTSNTTNTVLALSNQNGSDGTGVNNYVGINFSVANGATSTAQLQYVRTGDNSGKFEFKARNTSSSYPNIMTLLSSGNVGINRTDPDQKLNVSGNIELNAYDSAGGAAGYFTAKGLIIGNLYDAGKSYTGSDDRTACIWQERGLDLDFATNDALRMKITYDGNVGINQSNPTRAKLHVVGPGTGSDEIVAKFKGGNGSDCLSKIGIVAGYSDTANDSEGHVYIGALRQGNGNQSSMIFQTDGQNTRMRINANGRVDIGDELGVTHAGQFQVINTGGGQQDNDCLSFFETNGNDWCIKTNFNTSGSHYHAHFMQEGGTRATIAGDPGQNAVFTSGSDHRLKENVVDLTDAEGIDVIKNLKPRKYNWIANRENTGEINTVSGFIAHEVDEAGIGHLVYGNGKDAVKEDGSIDVQTLDYAGMTPVLAAAIKGLISKVEDLEQRLSAASL
jgi:hypothetical protein